MAEWVKALASNHGAISLGSPAALSGHIVSKRPEMLLQKREVLISEGTDNLQVIADFDYTLSSFMVGGKRGSTSHGVIENCDLLTTDYHIKARALKKEYYPKEIDETLSMEERITFMEEWVEQAHDVLIEGGFTKDKLVSAVRDANIGLRDQHDDVFRILQERKIPLLVFSGGIANVLEEVVRQHSSHPLPDTAHVISNRMVFSEEGNLVAFAKQVFHVFNKHAKGVLHEPYFQSEEVKRRGNVLLLGDSLGDLHMSEGMEARQVLSVGFLNDRVDERLGSYLEAYDVVILADGDSGEASLAYVKELLLEMR
ncbi:unnamed protein product [Chrysoparadoxa australica]